MPSKYTYLLIDIGSFIVPFIFSFHSRLKFNKEHNHFLKANILVSILFITWDMLYTHLGVWSFNERYVIGLYIYNLPVEEILFFLFIPYSSLFTYHCFKILIKNKSFIPAKVISIILVISLFVMGGIYYNRLYTAATFFCLAVLISFVQFRLIAAWLNNFYLMYLVILVPFFVVNGVLTGSGLEEPVVIYNDSENMGLRLITIPFEDMFYGMLLLLLNTLLYEFFQREKNKDTPHLSF